MLRKRHDSASERRPRLGFAKNVRVKDSRAAPPRLKGGIMKVTKRWIVIVDGGCARFIERDEQGRFRTVSSLEAVSLHMRSRDIGRDRPGRVYESADSSRHGTEPRHDLHGSEKGKFVALVIDEIENALQEGAFDEFVLVAPPKVLGEVRQALPATLAKVLTDTLSKDLTKIPDHELPAYFLR